MLEARGQRVGRGAADAAAQSQLRVLPTNKHWTGKEQQISQIYRLSWHCTIPVRLPGRFQFVQPQIAANTRRQWRTGNIPGPCAAVPKGEAYGRPRPGHTLAKEILPLRRPSCRPFP